jgi:hypothetical protein
MDSAYGEHIYVDDRTIDSHVKRLRTDRNPLWCRISLPRRLTSPYRQRSQQQKTRR